jgi:hypothetical protein
MTETPRSEFTKAVIDGEYEPNFYQMSGTMILSLVAFVVLQTRGGSTSSTTTTPTVPVRVRRHRWFEIAVALFFTADYILIVGNRWRIIGSPALLEGLWVCSLGLPLSAVRQLELNLVPPVHPPLSRCSMLGFRIVLRLAICLNLSRPPIGA